MNKLNYLLITTLATVSSPLMAQETTGDVVAEFYAQEYGVTVDEAARRFKTLASINDVEQKLLDKFPNQFGGLYIQHKPDFKVIVKMTGAGQGLLKQITSDPLYVVEKAERPIKMLNQLKDRIARDLADSKGEYSVSVDVWLGTVNIETTDEISARAILKAETLRRGYVTLTQVESVYMPTATIYGGTKANATTGEDCTVGFNVSSSYGDGILTAGHCPERLTVSGVTFNTVKEAWKSSYNFGFDMQLMRPSSTQVYPNKTYTHSSSAYIMDIKQVYGAQAVPINWTICAFGKTTNSRRCGTLREKNVALREQDSGIVNNVFVAKSNDGRRFVDGGDSGCPVFGTETAYGLIKGYRPSDISEMLFVDVSDSLATGGLEADVIVKTAP